MKTMLKTTLSVIALAATAGFASAHNYKEQLNDLNSSWECQDHFDRGDVIAGNIDKFEFCVWYLNNNKEAFTRDLHWYSILPSGDVVAVKKNLLTSDHKAKSVIETAVHKIIVANLKKEHAANVAKIEANNAKIVSDLNDDIDGLEAELATIATTLGDRDPADVIAELKKLGDDIVTLTKSRDDLKVLFDADQLDIAAIKTVLNDAIEIQQETALAAAQETAQELMIAKAALTTAQGVIDGLAEIRDLMDVAPADLQEAINTIIAERDGYKATVDSLNTQLEGFNVEFSETVLKDIYDSGFAAGVNSVDITTDNQGIYMIGYDDGVSSVNITADNAQAIADAKAAALAGAPDPIHKKSIRLVLMEKAAGGAQIEDSLRVKYTTATDSSVSIKFDYQWMHANGTERTSNLTVKVEDPKHFDFDYGSKAASYITDDGEAIEATGTANDDNYSTTLTVNYEVEIDNYYLSPYALALGTNIETNADKIAEFASKIANDFIEASFESGYLAGYGDGYADGYDDGYKDGYSDGWKDGVASVTAE